MTTEDAEPVLEIARDDSLLLLTDPDFDADAGVSLTDNDLEAFLSLPEVQQYVNPQL